MSSWYKVGTITVTNGSTTVIGSGTAWIANAAIGEALYAPDGRLYEITNIASDTAFTIAPAYLGATAAGASYVIVPSQSYIRDLAAQAADLVNQYSTIAAFAGQGKFGDGTLANPGVRFSDDLDTGFFRSASNEVTFVAGGVAQFKYNTSGLQFTGAGSLVNLTTTGNTTLGDAVADTVTINGTPTINAPTVITTSSTTDALRITQTGTGNALLVEDSGNPDLSPFVIDNAGNTLVGATTTPSIETITPKFSVSGVEGLPESIGIYNYRNAGGSGRATIAPRLFFARSRSAANGTVGGIVIDNEDLGQIRFAGDDGTQFLTAAEITAEVDGTPSTNDMPGRLVFSTTADGASSPTERVRITSAGNVGIGTSSPSRLLSLSGSSPIIGLIDTDTPSDEVFLRNQSGSATLFAQGLKNIVFGTAATERARIDSSGNLLINTTSPAAGSKLHVKANASTGGAAWVSIVTNSAGTTMFGVLDNGVISTGTDSSSPYNLTTGSAANVFVQSDGALFRSTSSLKYKTDVQDATHGLADVLKLRPVTYKGKNDGDKVFGGLIAEEVHEAGLTEFVQYATDDTPDALAYGNMVSLAFKAIQEQQAQIEQLRAEIETLKGN